MRIARATVAGILLASMLALGGCKKKKPAVPPPQAEAPAITQPAPETPPPVPAASEPNRPEPEPAQPETAPAATATPAPKPKSKPRPAKKTVPPPAAEKPAETTAEKQPSKTVVTEGGTQPATPQLSPTMPTDQKINQKMNTNQLLEATDYNLKSISRTLNADEQAMLQHIRSYMQQSRDAAKDADTERAYNLALKAHLLSDELIKH